jgi:FKBP-type peptidyl-prolyl cis-trans isomerase 2
MKLSGRLGFVLTAALLVFSCTGRTAVEGSSVSFDYSLSLMEEDGSKTEHSSGSAETVLGSGELIPGLETKLYGLKAGRAALFVIPPELAYGAYNPSMLVELPLRSFPGETDFTAGSVFETETPGGIISAVLVSKDDQNAVLDFNHPLAGKTLVFKIKELKVSEKKKD